MVPLLSQSLSFSSRRVFPSHGANIQNYIRASGSSFFRTDPMFPRQSYRAFTSTHIRPTGALRDQLTTQMGTYRHFLASSNQAKMDRVFHQGLQISLRKFGHLDTANMVAEDSWEKLAHCLRKYGETLPPFDPQDTQENIFNLFRFQRPLLLDEGLRFSHQSKDYITTVTELYWTLIFPNIAFTRGPNTPLLSREHISSIVKAVGASDPYLIEHTQMEKDVLDQMLLSSEEDALAAILLAAPYIHKDTLIHEAGCWSGENMVRLLYYAHLQGKTPFVCIGTDIHEIALNIGESTLNLLGIHSPHVQLHIANARYPLNFTSLNISYTQEVKMALKLIPVLLPEDARQFLEAARLSFRSPDSVLVVSYPILKGKMYELNEERCQTDSQQFYRVPFDGGVVFKTPFQAPEILPPYLKKLQDHNVVINAYYTEEGFNDLANACGYVVKQSICVGEYSNNYRIVSVLAQKSK